ncbi:MAG: Trk family potassium uptake protein [Defluviitaleaceae bacterium]|nr:Trk family potassium uptake protein [Defluviitaleaceae bacterium]
MKPTNTQIIVFSFLLLIAIGGFLLSLPIASRGGEGVPFMDAVFTATSAVCVTGMVLYDTYTQFTAFGQTVIICLVQIGGIGFMTIVTLFSVLLGRKIGLGERQLIMQASGMIHMSGAVRLIKKIIVGTLFFQGVGTIILSLRFISLGMGVGASVYNAWFHSISAFCNAGFDLMGKGEPFRSLAAFSTDPVILLTICMLIIIGGLGFLVWNDIFKHGLKPKRYSLHSKIVLLMTVILLSFSFLFFLLLEWNGVLADLAPPARALNSFFFAATTRTAGFTTFDIGSLSEPSKLLTMFLMFVGGNPGSTSGGLKTTTLLVLVLCALHYRNQYTAVFNRRLDNDTVKNAHAVFSIYVTVIFCAVFLISLAEPSPLLETAFEVIAAMGTTGLSLGVTASLKTFSRVILMLLMFFGRVGFITLIMALFGRQRNKYEKYVPEKILIG